MRIWQATFPTSGCPTSGPSSIAGRFGCAPGTAVRRPTRAAAATMLAPQAFDGFCAMLDAPMPQAVAELLSRKAAWE